MVNGESWGGSHLHVSYTNYSADAHVAYTSGLRLPPDVQAAEDPVSYGQGGISCTFGPTVSPVEEAEVLFQDEEEYNG